MSIEFQGAFEVARKRQDVYDLLSDPERFAPLLPDFQSLEKVGEEYIIKLKVGVSQIRGEATVRLRLLEQEPPTRAVYRGKGRVSAGSVQVDASFQLSEVSQGTQVDWKGQAQVFGMLKALAGGMLKPLAQKNIGKLIESLKKVIEQETEP